MDTDRKMTDTSAQASSNETEKQEQPKKDYTKRDYSKPANNQNYYNKQPYNRLDSSQGYYNKQPYNKDYQKAEFEKKPYQSPGYARDNKFLFKPKLVETKDGKHGYVQLRTLQFNSWLNTSLHGLPGIEGSHTKCT